MLSHIVAFLHELRRVGIPITVIEVIDALTALECVDLSNREAVKNCVRSATVKSYSHEPAYDTVFDIYFGTDSDEPVGPDGPEDASPLRRLTDAELRDAARVALVGGDRLLGRLVAAESVKRYAEMVTGRPSGTAYYMFKVLRRLNLEAIVTEVLRVHADPSDMIAALEYRFALDDYELRAAQIREAIDAEIRRRLVADRGAEAVASTLRRRLPEEVQITHATQAEMDELKARLPPLTRRLKAQISKKRRRARQGRLDLRTTIRHSLSYGGVMADLRFRPPPPRKPETIILADVSGSVAAVSQFALELIYAMGSESARVRSFLFTDTIAEVTQYLRGAPDINEAAQRINDEVSLTWMDGHSDYGHAFEEFWANWGNELAEQATVLILGDARSNYHASGDWVVDQIARRVASVYWLNPEPQSHWNSGDSLMSRFGTHCDGVWECRNLRQLSSFIEQLA